jgi:hypothetical protein
MIGHMTRNSLKSDPGIMLDFFEAGGGCSSRNSGTINSYPSLLPVPTLSLKYTKREFSELTRSEKVRGVVEVHEYLGCRMDVI